MTVLSATFETGTSTNTVSTGDAGSATAFDFVTIPSPATLTYSTTHYYDTLSAKIAASSATTNLCMGWNTALGTVTDHYGRLYVYYPTLSGIGSARIVLVQSGGNNAAAIRINSTGHIELLDQASTVRATSTAVIPTSTWIRLNFHFVHSTSVGAITVQYFAAADSSTVTETISASSINTKTNGDTIMFGLSGASPASHPTIYMDNLVANDVGYPTKASAPPLVITDSNTRFGAYDGMPPQITYDYANDTAKIWFRANGSWYYVTGTLP